MYGKYRSYSKQVPTTNFNFSLPSEIPHFMMMTKKTTVLIFLSHISKSQEC